VRAVIFDNLHSSPRSGRDLHDITEEDGGTISMRMGGVKNYTCP
jgi:hypothetical protein